MEEIVRVRRRTNLISVKRLLLAGIFVAAATGLAVGLFLWLRDGGSDDSIRVVTGVEMPYPSGWDEQPLTEADANAGLLLSLERDRPQASFLARSVIAGLAEDFDVDQLAADSEAALAAEVENFELRSSRSVPIGSYEAVQITYAQTDAGGLGANQVTMTIVPTENQTFYLTFRADTDDFAAIEADGLELTDTFVAYVAEALQ